MWSWFGGAAAQKRKDAPKNAILLLREQLDMLQKREKHLENQVAEQDSAARKHVNTNKNGTITPTSYNQAVFGRLINRMGIEGLTRLYFVQLPKPPSDGKRFTKRTSSRQQRRSFSSSNKSIPSKRLISTTRPCRR